MAHRRKRIPLGLILYRNDPCSIPACGSLLHVLPSISQTFLSIQLCAKHKNAKIMYRIFPNNCSHVKAPCCVTYPVVFNLGLTVCGRWPTGCRTWRPWSTSPSRLSTPLSSEGHMRTSSRDPGVQRFGQWMSRACASFCYKPSVRVFPAERLWGRTLTSTVYL